ncbi:MAG: ABC transporter permease [Bryobacteraceae bacterium]
MGWRPRRRFEEEMERELRFHLDEAAAKYMRAGMARNAAYSAAEQRLGRREFIKDECRDTRGSIMLETTLQDLRYGARVLLKNPGFTLAAVLTLAAGIGANTAIFSVVYGVLLRPLPYAKGSDLVVLHQKTAQADDLRFSVPEITDYREGNKTLSAVVEHHSMVFLLLGKNIAERVQTAVVSANFFPVLGVEPKLGRTFVADDERPGADAVLVLSHNYWMTRHGGDPSIVGKVFQMNSRVHTVIGVLPPIPQYPQESDVYMPTSQCPTRSSARFQQNRTGRMMTVFGRLKPGVSLASAQADLSAQAGRMAQAYPEFYPREQQYGIVARGLREELTEKAQPALLVLLCATCFVLLIACANVANLLLARLLRVERELAVRTALGASRWRLVRQLLAEGVLLSLAGGLLGVALAPLALRMLVGFAERFTTRAAEVSIDTPVLVFSLMLAVLTGLLFSLAPALAVSRLQTGAGRQTGSRSKGRLRTLLVVAQVAVSFVLLVGAGLMVRSFQKLQRESPGFRPERLLTMRVTPNFYRYVGREKLDVLWQNVLRKVGEVPGVTSVASTSNAPFDPAGIAVGPGNVEFQIEGRPVSPGTLAPTVDLTGVSARYFATIGQPVLAGREFTERDDNAGLRVAVINETLARHRWPGEDAVGRRITLDAGKTWIQIEGVAGDVKEYGLDKPVGDEVYLPTRQTGFAGILLVRTNGDPMRMAEAVRRGLAEVDPELAVDRVSTIMRFQEESMAPARLTTLLLGLFAGLALAMSMSGLAAVMALTVSQRTQELGIRLALGAPRGAVLQLVTGHGLGMTVAGLAIGVAGSFLLTRFLEHLLYATSATDTVTFVSAGLSFLAVAGVACVVPAWRVMRIDPVAAIRQE